MDKLKKNLTNLKTLSCCKKKIKDKLIKKGQKDLIDCLDECVYNTLNGNVKLSPKNKIKPSRYKYSLRKLLKKSHKDKKKNYNTRRRVLTYFTTKCNSFDIIIIK